MIKLQDFARERGVTDRQVQRLLQKYASEVEGLFQRKGPNGTWLSEEACEILRSKMKSNPVSNIVDTREVDELKKKLAEAEDKIKNKEQYITALEAGNLRQQKRLNELESNQLLLEESYKQIDDLKSQNADLSAEKEKIDKEAKEAIKKAQENVLKFSEAFEDERKQKEKAEAYAAELAEYIALPFFKRLRTKKPVLQNLEEEGKE